MLQGQTVQKMKLAILDGDELAAAYSVPRLIALEYQLNRMCKNNERLDGILQLIKNHPEKQSEVITEISGPFLWRLSHEMRFRKSNDLCNQASCNNHQF